MYTKNTIFLLMFPRFPVFPFSRLLILMLSFLWLSGCGQDDILTGSSDRQLKMEFQLAPDTTTQANVGRIELTVSGPDMAEPRVFSITDVDNERSTARGLIQVPVGKGMTFFARAFEADCPVLVGSSEDVEIASGDSGPIVIELSHLQTFVAVRSEQESLSVGDDYFLEVYVEDAPRLSALTCELAFDEALLSPVDIVPGDFFGDDVLFIEDSEFPRRQENRLVLGITLKRGATGVCGSGVVFRIAFETRGRGDAEVALLTNVTLTTPDFEQIEDPSRIRIGPGSLVKIQ